MAYTNETTHFGFPLPLGSDLTVPMDYNESLEEADTALFEAQTNAAGAVGTAGNALTVANEAKTEAQSATDTANSATATAQAAATAANEAVASVASGRSKLRPSCFSADCTVWASGFCGHETHCPQTANQRNTTTVPGGE